MFLVVLMILYHISLVAYVCDDLLPSIECSTLLFCAAALKIISEAADRSNDRITELVGPTINRSLSSLNLEKKRKHLCQVCLSHTV